MQHEAENGGYVAYVQGGTTRSIAEYLELWATIPVGIVQAAAQHIARLQYLVDIRLSYANPAKGNAALKGLLLMKFNSPENASDNDKWSLEEWLRGLSFENFFLVCRIGNRLLHKPLCEEFSDLIREFVGQERRHITISTYMQAYRLLEDEIPAKNELKHQWEKYEKDLKTTTHRDDTTPNNTDADLPSTETTINNSAGSAAPQIDHTPPSSAQREVHHLLSQTTPYTRTNAAQPLAGTSDRRPNAPQSRDDGIEGSLDGAQSPPSTNPIIYKINPPPKTTADLLLKAQNEREAQNERVIRHNSQPDTRSSTRRKRAADDNIGPDGREKLLRAGQLQQISPTQIRTGGGGSVEEQDNSQHGRAPQLGTLEQQGGHTADSHQLRGQQYRGTQLGGPTWPEGCDEPPPGHISHLQNPSQSYHQQQPFPAVNSANLSPQTPPRTFQTAGPQFQPLDVQHSLNPPPSNAQGPHFRRQTQIIKAACQESGYPKRPDSRNAGFQLFTVQTLCNWWKTKQITVLGVNISDNYTTLNANGLELKFDEDSSLLLAQSVKGADATARDLPKPLSLECLGAFLRTNVPTPFVFFFGSNWDPVPLAEVKSPRVTITMKGCGPTPLFRDLIVARDFLATNQPKAA